MSERVCGCIAMALIAVGLLTMAGCVVGSIISLFICSWCLSHICLGVAIAAVCVVFVGVLFMFCSDL